MMPTVTSLHTARLAVRPVYPAERVDLVALEALPEAMR
jgi:hypothetical protein